MRKILIGIFSSILIFGIFFLGLFAVSRDSFIRKFTQTPVAASSGYEVFGFAPYWTLFNLGNINWKILTTFAYFSLPVLSNGSVDRNSYEWQVFGSEQLNTLFAKAWINHVKRVITFTQMDPHQIEALLGDRYAWERFTQESIQILRDRQLDGVNIDFEYIPSNDRLRAQFSDFTFYYTSELRKNLDHPYITVSVLASSAKDNHIYDVGYLAKQADAIFMMAYDFYYPGSGMVGPSAPLFGYNDGKGPFWYDVSSAVSDFLKVADSDKIIMGVPYYGWNYPTFDPRPGGERTWGRAAFATTQERTQRDRVLETTPIGGWDDAAKVAWRGYWNESGWHVIYMEDKKSLSLKYDFAKGKNLKGIGIWALGFDQGNDLWSVLEEKFFGGYFR